MDFGFLSKGEREGRDPRKGVGAARRPHITSQMSLKQEEARNSSDTL
jgi:hypothetical protein